VNQPQQRVENPKADNGSFIVVNGDGCIAGRMCSHVSKLLLKGCHVAIVNAEKAMISGDKYKTIKRFKEDLEISSATNPIHGPFHPRRPDRILTKMVRGMVPKRKSSGISAFKRLRVYIGVPNQLKDSKMELFEDSRIKKSASYYISIGDVAQEIGWKRVTTVG
jgi:large subunit ribosomal protein L13